MGNAAATVREEGFPGPVVLITREPGVPFGRPPLSKTYLRSEEDLDGWYVRRRLVRRPRRRAPQRPQRRGRRSCRAHGDPGLGRATHLSQGPDRHRRPEPAAHDSRGWLPGIHYLRTVAECDAIKREATAARRAVVVGMGFIGCEVAASLTQLGVQVTAVFPGKTAGPGPGRRGRPR